MSVVAIDRLVLSDENELGNLIIDLNRQEVSVWASIFAALAAAQMGSISTASSIIDKLLTKSKRFLVADNVSLNKLLTVLNLELKAFSLFVYSPQAKEQAMLPHNSSKKFALDVSFSEWLKLSVRERLDSALSIITSIPDSRHSNVVNFLQVITKPLSDVNEIITKEFTNSSNFLVEFLSEAVQELAVNRDIDETTSLLVKMFVEDIDVSEVIVTSYTPEDPSNNFDQILSDSIFRTFNTKRGFDVIVAIVEASVPTRPHSERLIESLQIMVNLVINVIVAYEGRVGDKYPVDGLSKLWQLVRCTPKSVSDFESSDITRKIDKQLDGIQIALGIMDVINQYFSDLPEAAWLLYSSDCELYRISARSLLRMKRYVNNLVKNSHIERLLNSMGDTLIKIDFSLESVSLSELIVMKMCVEVGIKESASILKKREKEYTRLIKDVGEFILTTESPKSKSTIVAALLHSMILYGSVDLVLQVAKYIHQIRKQDEPKRRKSKLQNNLTEEESNTSSFGAELFNLLNQTTDYAELFDDVLIKASQDIFNSVPSCNSEELVASKTLLDNLLSEKTLFSDRLRFEVALHDLATNLAVATENSSEDIVPLRLRILGPIERAQFLINNQLYQRLDLRGRHFPRGSNNQSSSRRQSSSDVIRNTRDGPTPGSQMMQLLFSLSPNEEYRIQMMLLLLQNLILEGDFEGGYRLASKILLSPITSTLRQGSALMREVEEGITSLIKVLESKDSPLTKILADDLLQEAMSCLGTEFALKCESKWRSERVKDEDYNTADAKDKLLKYSMVSVATRLSYEQAISLPLPSTADFLQSLPTISKLSLSEGVLLLKVKKDTKAKHKILAEVASSLEAKVSSAPSSSDRATESELSVEKLDRAVHDRVLAALQKKGFSKNGSKRSLAAVVSKFSVEGYEEPALISESLKWAIDHSHDRGFDNPFTFVVKGALLPEEPESVSLENIDAIKTALKVIDDLGHEICGDTWNTLQGSLSSSNSIASTPLKSENIDSTPRKLSDAQSSGIRTPISMGSRTPNNDRGDISPYSLTPISPDPTVDPQIDILEKQKEEQARQATAILKLRKVLSQADGFLSPNSASSRMELLLLTKPATLASELISSNSVTPSIIAMRNLVLLLSRLNDPSVFAFIESLVHSIPKAQIELVAEAFKPTRIDVTRENEIRVSMTKDEVVLWHAAASRMEMLLTSQLSSSSEAWKSLPVVQDTLLKDPAAYLDHLSAIFLKPTVHSNADILSLLKQQASEALQTSGNDVIIRVMTQLRIEGDPFDVKEMLFKQLQEDIATIRRISRVPSSLTVNITHLLPSESLLSMNAVRPQSDRISALSALLPHLLSASAVQSWNRAVGRVLGIGPQELNFYCAINILQQLLSNASTYSPHEAVSGVSAELSSVFGRIGNELGQRVLSIIAGVYIPKPDSEIPEVIKLQFHLSENINLVLAILTYLATLDPFPPTIATTLTEKKLTTSSTGSITATKRTTASLRATKLAMDDISTDSALKTTAQDAPLSPQGSLLPLVNALLSFLRTISYLPSDLQRRARELYAVDGKSSSWKLPILVSALTLGSIIQPNKTENISVEEIKGIMSELGDEITLAATLEVFGTCVHAIDGDPGNCLSLIRLIKECLPAQIWQSFTVSATSIICSVPLSFSADVTASMSLCLISIYYHLHESDSAKALLVEESMLFCRYYAATLVSYYLAAGIDNAWKRVSEELRNFSARSIVTITCELLADLRSGTLPATIPAIECVVLLLRLSSGLDRGISVSQQFDPWRLVDNFESSVVHQEDLWLELLSVTVSKGESCAAIAVDIMLVDLRIAFTPLLNPARFAALAASAATTYNRYPLRLIQIQLLCGAIDDTSACEQLVRLSGADATEMVMSLFILLLSRKLRAASPEAWTSKLVQLCRVNGVYPLLVQQSTALSKSRLNSAVLNTQPEVKQRLSHASLERGIRENRLLPYLVSPLGLSLEMVNAGLLVEGLRLYSRACAAIEGQESSSLPFSPAATLPLLLMHSEAHDPPGRYKGTKEVAEGRFGWKMLKEAYQQVKRTFK